MVPDNAPLLDHSQPADEASHADSHPHGDHDDALPIVDRLKLGSLAGTAAFALVVLFAHLLTTAAQFGTSPEEVEPSTVPFSGFVFLTSHGGTFIEGFDTVPATFGGIGFAPMFLVPLAAVTFTAAGYALARQIRPASLQGAVKTGVTVAPAYVILTALLANSIEHTPEADGDGAQIPGSDVETLAIAIDAGLVLTTLAFVTVFACLGAFAAVSSRIYGLERSSERTSRGEGSTAEATGPDRSRDREATESTRVGDDSQGLEDENATARDGDNARSRATGPSRSADAATREDATANDQADRHRSASSRLSSPAQSTESGDHDRYKPSHLRSTDAGVRPGAEQSAPMDEQSVPTEGQPTAADERSTATDAQPTDTDGRSTNTDNGSSGSDRDEHEDYRP